MQEWVNKLLSTNKSVGEEVGKFFEDKVRSQARNAKINDYILSKKQIKWSSIINNSRNIIIKDDSQVSFDKIHRISKAQY